VRLKYPDGVLLLAPAAPPVPCNRLAPPSNRFLEEPLLLPYPVLDPSDGPDVIDSQPPGVVEAAAPHRDVSRLLPLLLPGALGSRSRPREGGRCCCCWEPCRLNRALVVEL
jgi:hypothetical protein